MKNFALQTFTIFQSKFFKDTLVIVYSITIVNFGLNFVQPFEYTFFFKQRERKKVLKFGMELVK